MRWPALLLVVLAACSKSPLATASDAAAPPPADAAPMPTDAKVALSPADEVRRAVRAWNDALDRHDTDALDALYANQVFFYTSDRTKAQVLAAKTSALGPSSTFHQQIIGDINVVGYAGTWTATFTKRSGNGTKLAKSNAVLVLRGIPLLIKEERDAPTRDACEREVMGVVNALPAVKQNQDDVFKALTKYPDRHYGGIGPMTEDDGTVTGSLGVHQPERFESEVIYTYDLNGILEVVVMGDRYTTDSGAASDPAHVIPDSPKLKAACGR